MCDSLSPKTHRQRVYEFNRFTNDVVGVLAFAMGVSALSFNENASSIATVSFIFLLLYTIFKQIEYFRDIRLWYMNWSYVALFLDFIKYNLIYAVGLVFLVLIASGLITSDTFAGFSIAELIN